MENGNTILSIIVPAYNAEKYIGRCIQSILCSKPKEAEIILVDDGSTDNTPHICDAFCKENTQIKVIHKENGGTASARNAGMDYAEGKWITFVDADDTVSENYCQTIINATAENTKADVIIFGITVNIQSCKKRIEYSLPAFCGEISDCVRKTERAGLLNYTLNKVYKRSIIENTPRVGFLCGMEPGEDTLFNCYYFSIVKKGAILPDTLYEYYKYEDVESSLSHKYWEDLNEKILIFTKARCDLYSSLKMDSDSDKKELAKQNVYYIFKCIPNMHRKSNPTSRKKRLEFFNGIMHNKEVNAWVSKDTSGDMLIKIFRHLYKIKSPIICDAVYCFLFWIKRNLLNN